MPDDNDTCGVTAEIVEVQIEHQIYNCDKCEYSALNDTDVKRHMMSVHEGEVMMDVEKPSQVNANLKSIQDICCIKCEFETEDPQQLVNRKLVTHRLKTNQCVYCDFVAKDEQDLKMHIQRAHECEKCDYKSNDERNMRTNNT